MDWRSLVRYPDCVGDWASETLDAAQELAGPPEEDRLGDRIHAMETWWKGLVKAGILRQGEVSRLRDWIGPHM